MSLLIEFIAKKLGLSTIGISIVLTCVIMCTLFGITGKHFYDKNAELKQTIVQLEGKVETLNGEKAQLEEKIQLIEQDKKIDEKAILAAIDNQFSERKEVASVKTDLKIRVAELKQPIVNKCVASCLGIKKPAQPKTTVAVNKPVTQPVIEVPATPVEEVVVSNEMTPTEQAISNERLDEVWRFYCKKLGSGEAECKNISPQDTVQPQSLSTGSESNHAPIV